MKYTPIQSSSNKNNNHGKDYEPSILSTTTATTELDTTIAGSSSSSSNNSDIISSSSNSNSLSEWKHNDIIKSLVDTLLPSISINDSIDDNNINKDDKIYWEYDLCNDITYMNIIQDTITTKLSTTNQFLLNSILLPLLSTSIGTSLLCTTFTFKPFYQLSQHHRIKILQKLECSTLLFQRQLFQSFKHLLCGIAFTYYHKNNHIESSYYNPFWKAIGYIPGPNIEQSCSKTNYNGILKTSNERKHQQQKQEEHDLISNAILPNNVLEQDELLEYDYIIVGSGASGCVAAYTLCEQLSKTTSSNDDENSSISILLIEQGSYISKISTMTNLEFDSMNTMYLQHGLFGTNNDNNNIIILAGNTFGGGTEINWACCLPLPYHVLQEWNQYLINSITNNQNKNDDNTNEIYNIPLLDNDYDMALQHIMNQIGATYNNDNDTKGNKNSVPPYNNRMNEILYNGCKNLDWDVSYTGQNVQRPYDHSTGYICFGDRDNNKLSGIRAFLLPALQKCNSNTNSNNKCKLNIITNCSVQRIITSNNNKQQLLSNNNNKKQRIATGVECYTTTGTTTSSSSKQQKKEKRAYYQIKAKHGILLAAGALQTPCILQRSKVFHNKHIGKHLRLHPVVGIFGSTMPVSAIPSIPLSSLSSVDASSILPVVESSINSNDNDNDNDTRMITTTETKTTLTSATNTIKKYEKINCFLGAPMTVVCNEFQMGINNDGYGYKLECPSLHPGIGMAISSWKSPIDIKQSMYRFAYGVPIIVLQRDYSSSSTSNSMDGGGTVTCNKHNEVLIDYTIHPNDLQSLLHGTLNAIRVLASDPSIVEIRTPHIHDPWLQLESTTKVTSKQKTQQQQQHVQNEIIVNTNKNKVETYLQHIQNVGIKNKFDTLYASAHQMGTCRLSSTPADGVVDCITGETWECNNLYIIDTSIFPTASGSNPMVTTFTLSYMFVSRIVLLHKLRSILLNATTASATTATAKVSSTTKTKKAIQVQGEDEFKLYNYLKLNLDKILSKYDMTHTDYEKAVQLRLQQVSMRSSTNTGSSSMKKRLTRQQLVTGMTQILTVVVPMCILFLILLVHEHLFSVNLVTWPK